MFHFKVELTVNDVAEWIREYLPPYMKDDSLIVDVGAREGDTAVFFYMLGYRNLRLIEPSARYKENLIHNSEILRMFGCKVEVITESFRPEHLSGAAFVKFDCEGCEYEIDLDKIKIPWVAEMHDKLPADESGVYEYSHARGYRRGPKAVICDLSAKSS